MNWSQYSLEIDNYINELQSIVNECDRPAQDSDKCLQCNEKQRVIDRLKRIRYEANSGNEILSGGANLGSAPHFRNL